MQLKRMALVAGMTAAATAGLASQAWAAPADTSVSERQCFDGDGRVQREADGVGTCVGGTNDGLLIDDGDDRTGDADDTSSSRSDADDDADGDSDDSAGYGTGYGRDRSDDTDATGRTDRSDSDDADDDRSARRDRDDDTSSRSSGPAAAYRF